MAPSKSLLVFDTSTSEPAPTATLFLPRTEAAELMEPSWPPPIATELVSAADFSFQPLAPLYTLPGVIPALTRPRVPPLTVTLTSDAVTGSAASVVNGTAAEQRAVTANTVAKWRFHKRVFLLLFIVRILLDDGSFWVKGSCGIKMFLHPELYRRIAKILPFYCNKFVTIYFGVSRVHYLMHGTAVIEELLDVLEAVFSDSDGAGGPLPSCLNCSKARRTSSILMAP